MYFLIKIKFFNEFLLNLNNKKISDEINDFNYKDFL